jgi:hypothetical protein
MLNIREWNKRRLTDPVIRARAGLTPASDWIAYEKELRMTHQARVFRAVKAYARSVTRGSESQAIIDILACLRQYCDCKGLGFQRLDALAFDLHSEHTEGHALRTRFGTHKK